MPSDPLSSSELELARIRHAIDVAKFERERTEFSKSQKDNFWNKNAGTLVSATVTIIALMLSTMRAMHFSGQELALKSKSAEIETAKQKIEVAKR